MHNKNWYLMRLINTLRYTIHILYNRNGRGIVFFLYITWLTIALAPASSFSFHFPSFYMLRSTPLYSYRGSLPYDYPPIPSVFLSFLSYPPLHYLHPLLHYFPTIPSSHRFSHIFHSFPCLLSLSFIFPVYFSFHRSSILCGSVFNPDDFWSYKRMFVAFSMF